MNVPTKVEIPEPLRLRHRTTVDGRAWLSRLPGFISRAVEQWQLTIDMSEGAPPWHGHTGLVMPVVMDDGGRAALKIAFPHEEALLEPLALELWNGHGAVKLLACDDSLGALLINRLDERRSLMDLPVDQAVVIWGELVRKLSIRPDDRAHFNSIPRIAATAERYCDELPQRWSDLGEPFPRWLLEAALEVCQLRGDVARRSSNDVLVHTDLHYLNVLAIPGASRYQAIDPQVQVGDAEFSVAPCLWNRIRDLPVRNAEAGLRRRALDLAQAGGLDPDLAAAWTVVREVENALCYTEEHSRGDVERSLWVASVMAGKPLPGLPAAHQLKELS